MKGKITWLTVSSLMVLSLVIAACAPAVVEKPEVTEKPKPEVVEKPVVVEPVAEVEKPKYGGVIKVGKDSDIGHFDAAGGNPASAITAHYTNQPLTGTDWTKGWAGGYGTKETEMSAKVDLWGNKVGIIAESWELPKAQEGDTGVMTYRIRKGINWALNPDSEASRLVGGRELTTEDVLWSLQITITDRAQYLYSRNPELRGAKITSPAPWTIKIEAPWDIYETVSFRFSDYVLVFPPEVYQKYGNMNKWQLSVGTGPFMLTNNVASSSATFVRNPNFWMKDPIGPGKGNQLPYLDGVKIFIIPDTSTLLAALRTAKIDGLADDKTKLNWDAIADTVRLQPKLKYKMKGMGSAGAIAMRLDKAPFNDIRVRQALMLATDFESIREHFFAGQAQIVVNPIPYLADYAAAYYGPEPDGVWPADATELSKSLYVYNPEKAKQLLAEAGYPQGFKTNIYSGSEAADIDYLSIVKDMWRKVGIDLEIRPEESGARAVRERERSFDALFDNGSPNPLQYHMLPLWYGETYRNLSGVSDPRVDEAYPKIQAIRLFDEAESMRLFRELAKYAHDQTWYLPAVSAAGFEMWWPWIKNYNGERFLGNLQRQAYTYVWLDEALKKEMGY